MKGSPTIQVGDVVNTGTEEKPPVCTTEEWEKFCEEEGLEDGTKYNNEYFANDSYTLTAYY